MCPVPELFPLTRRGWYRFSGQRVPCVHFYPINPLKWVEYAHLSIPIRTGGLNEHRIPASSRRSRH